MQMAQTRLNNTFLALFQPCKYRGKELLIRFTATVIILVFWGVIYLHSRCSYWEETKRGGGLPWKRKKLIYKILMRSGNSKQNGTTKRKSNYWRKGGQTSPACKTWVHWPRPFNTDSETTVW